MVWPPRSSLQLMDQVRLSYEQAASSVNGIFLPAGEAWRLALQEDPALMLYGPDQYHPGALGTYLAALVIYARLSEVDPRTLPATYFVAGRRVNMSANTVQALQRAAYNAITNQP
jgi:hypothetical protein